jgi:hypothetical protein
MGRLAARLEGPISLAVVLGATALIAAVVVPQVHAHASAGPVNTKPPSLVVVPAVGSMLDVTRGEWSPADSKLTYLWLFCKGGSDCTEPNQPPYPDPGGFLLERSEIGYSFQAREFATDPVNGAQAHADSEVSPVTIEPQGDLGFTGCPSAPDTNGLSVTQIQPPARLLIDRHTSSPAVITRSTQRLTLRFHVVACNGLNVQGALLYATPTPYEQFVGSEHATNADGWATITLTRQRFFPATPRQQNLIVFARARKPGEDLLGGVSTRRLVSFRVRLG